MARGEGTINVKFLADLADLKKGLKDGGDQVGGFGDNMKKMAGNVVGALGSLGVATFLKDATQAAAEDAAAHDKLARSLKNSIGAWDGQVDAIEKWITKAQFAKGFSDTDLREAFAGLTEVTHSVTDSQNLMGIAMDLSRAKGIPLAQAADILAKAHEGNTKAVKAQLPELGSLIAENASADEIIAKVSDTVKGQADTFADSAAGKTEIFHQKMGELTETIGSKLLPILSGLVDWLVRVTDWFAALPGPVQTGIVVVAGIAAALVGLNSVLGIASAAAAAFGVTLNLSLGPIALVVAAIVGIGVAIYALVKNWDTVKSALKSGIDAVLGWFSDLGGKLARVGSGMWDWIGDALKAVLNHAIDLLNTFIRVALGPLTLLNKVRGLGAVIPDSLANLKIDRLDQGGIVSSPTIAMLAANNRPEAVVPLGRGGIGTTVFNITITGAQDRAGVAREIEGILTDFVRQGGNLRFI